MDEPLGCESLERGTPLRPESAGATCPRCGGVLRRATGRFAKGWECPTCRYSWMPGELARASNAEERPALIFDEALPGDMPHRTALLQLTAAAVVLIVMIGVRYAIDPGSATFDLVFIMLVNGLLPAVVGFIVAQRTSLAYLWILAVPVVTLLAASEGSEAGEQDASTADAVWLFVEATVGFLAAAIGVALGSLRRRRSSRTASST